MTEITASKKERAARFFTKLGAGLKRFAAENYLMLGYIAAAVLCELTGIAVTSGKFYMTQPWLYLTFIALICFISLYLNGNGKRYALFVTALAANFALDMMFIILYDSTGTVFDYAMLNLRTDAMMIVESVPISFTYIFVTAIIIAVYCTLGQMYKKKLPAPKTTKFTVILTSVLLAVTIGLNVLITYLSNYKNDSNDLSYKLYQTETGTYSNKGLIANFYSEMARGLWFSDIDVGDRDELDAFFYAETTEPTDYFGKAAGFNTVTVLCESFEWFTFLFDAERYPDGYARAVIAEDGSVSPQDAQKLIDNLHELYPNLYRFYESDSTVVLNNSYSLEKTDISENKAIIGNYPLYEYINYAYPYNSLPYSMPNLLKGMNGTVSKSFHDGYKTFYNRNIHHVNALGFETYTAAEDMDFEDDDTGLGERNLDSLMFDSCKEEMFPVGTAAPFNTFITTITQHGQYAYRESLKPYYEKMDALGVLPFDSKDDDANALRYYCAAGMDLDKAIGIMLDYLEEKGLADSTLITLYGDHNCYYQGVSNYVKDIYSYSVDNYTELYRVPVMIKVGKQALGNPVIQKFTCVSDIYPTILDLLGIKTFSNLTYGVSAFSDKESILYSRAYDKFITDKIYFNSLNHVIYKSDDVDDAYLADVEKRALDILDKISHVNRMFAGNTFAGKEQTFFSKLKAINGVE